MNGADTAHVGFPLHVFRLMRFGGPGGCAHHLLAWAGRPSHPDYDQSAEDAADSLLDATLATAGARTGGYPGSAARATTGPR